MPLTLAERILAHLAAYPIEDGAADVPRQVTQEGIADALGVQVAHVSRALKTLIAQGSVSAHLAHPAGGTRRARAHALSEKGWHAARALPPPSTTERAGPRGEMEPAARIPAGRGKEFETLVAWWDEAKANGPRMVLVEGDAGSGKTRLVEAFAAEVARRGARVLTARAAPVGEAQLLGPLAGALGPVGFERRYRARTAGTPRERALAAATESLVATARQEPLAIVLDDLHYAGASVADFLHGLYRSLPAGTRALVLASFRREEEWALPNGPLYTALMPLRDAPGAKHLVLSDLDRSGVKTLLEDAGAHVLGDTRLADELVDRVWRESGGNASFALAMGAELADGVDEEDFFPASVRSAAKERFSAMSESALAVLQAAAVAGPDVEYRVLRFCTDLAETDLVTTLDVLIDKLLLEEAPAAGGNAELRVRFRHPKVRDALLADMTATRRRWLEEKVASAHQA